MHSSGCAAILPLAWLFLVAAGATAWDVSEWLEQEGHTDKAASGNAKCWCKELTELVSSRLSTSNDEIEQLGRTKESKHYENVRLRMEVQEHQREAHSHSQSGATHEAITTRKHQESQATVDELKESLRGVRKALDALPAGSDRANGDVHSTLKSLEDKFSDHLEKEQSSMEAGQQQAEGLQESKQEMMRLANKNGDAKRKRLASGLATVAEAQRQIAVFGKQQESDYSLQSAVSSLCGSLESQATERLNKRQAVAVHGSQAEADQAQSEAMKSAGLVLLRKQAAAPPRNATAGTQALRGRSGMAAIAQVRRVNSSRGDQDCFAQRDLAETNERLAREKLSTEEKVASSLLTDVAKSSDIESGLKTMLHGQMMGAHLAEGKVSDAQLKASIDELFSLVQTQIASLEAPFGAVRAAGRSSSLADSKLVLELRSSVADAQVAAIAAKTC